tara:strand:- start:254 stop:400 length:147 start_codon:yes stop_codon:yes gene_type:complete
MKNPKTKTVTIPSNWTNKQIDFYVKQLAEWRKDFASDLIGIKIIIEYI